MTVLSQELLGCTQMLASESHAPPVSLLSFTRLPVFGHMCPLPCFVVSSFLVNPQPQAYLFQTDPSLTLNLPRPSHTYRWTCSSLCYGAPCGLLLGTSVFRAGVLIRPWLYSSLSASLSSSATSTFFGLRLLYVSCCSSGFLIFKFWAGKSGTLPERFPPPCWVQTVSSAQLEERGAGRQVAACAPRVQTGDCSEVGSGELFLLAPALRTTRSEDNRYLKNAKKDQYPEACACAKRCLGG